MQQAGVVVALLQRIVSAYVPSPIISPTHGRRTYRYSRTQEKISGSSSGRSILLLSASRNWPLTAAAKNGDAERTSSWAAKSRPSLPTLNVTIGEVRVLQLRTSVTAQFRLRRTGSIPPDWRAPIERLLQFRQLCGILIRLLQLDNLIHAIIRAEGALEHGCHGD